MSANPTGGVAAAKPNGPPTPNRSAARRVQGPLRPAIAGGPGKLDHMGRYLEMLGVGPRATLDEINTAYFTLVKRFPENPTEEDEAKVQELRRAYDIVSRRYVPPKTKGFKVIFDRRVALPLMAVVALALAGTFLWMNWNNVRVQLTHHEPGAVLRLKSAAAPYGTVTGFESTHRFPAGAPAPAYAIRLADKDETVWVSERLVVLGMEPAGK